MELALSQVCTLNSPFPQDIEDFAAGQCFAIDIWLTKLESYLKSGKSIADARKLLDEHQVAVPVASFQGGLFGRTEAANESWNLLSNRLALCAELGTKTIVVAFDMVGPISQQDIDCASEDLARATRLAAEHDVRVAIEFRADAVFGNNLQTAAALVNEIGAPNLGLCFDVFHYYVGPSKPEDLGYLRSNNLFHVQLSDIADVPREFARDSDRILPGDGDIPFGPIIDRLREISYEGPVSIELMNPQIWQVPPRQFGEIGMTALRKVLGQASMN